MRYFKQVENGYITSIGTGYGGTEITEAEYTEIMTVIQNRPQETPTTGYRLKENLTWESYEKEPEPEPSEIDETEAFNILIGGAA